MQHRIETTRGRMIVEKKKKAHHAIQMLLVEGAQCPATFFFPVLPQVHVLFLFFYFLFMESRFHFFPFESQCTPLKKKKKEKKNEKAHTLCCKLSLLLNSFFSVLKSRAISVHSQTYGHLSIVVSKEESCADLSTRFLLRISSRIN